MSCVYQYEHYYELSLKHFLRHQNTLAHILLVVKVMVFPLQGTLDRHHYILLRERKLKQVTSYCHSEGVLPLETIMVCVWMSPQGFMWSWGDGFLQLNLSL